MDAEGYGLHPAFVRHKVQFDCRRSPFCGIWHHITVDIGPGKEPVG
jgi:hypothetical protein